MNIPAELRYSSEHEWVRVDGARATIGVTDYAQDALGDVVYVDLPDVGATVTANAKCGDVESTKSVSAIYSPVGGTIVEANGELADTPERVNEDPYGSGWMFTVEMADPSELDALLDAAGYQQLIDAP
jgi:glycine cleavage system H protein